MSERSANEHRSGDAPAVYCPLVTPFDEDGKLDTDSLRTLVESLLESGVDGLVPCGTTGEFAALTDDERRRVVETTVEAASDRVPVVAGVGGTAVDAIRGRIADATAAGADALIVITPYFGGQASATGNESFFRAVLRDASLPAYLYEIPSAVGQQLRPETIASLSRIETVVGIKDSTGDLTRVGEVLARTPEEFAVLQGWDSQFVPGLVMGADGGINALSHLVPDTFDASSRALADGDLERARSIQFERIDPAFRTCLEHGFAPTIKAALKDRGVLADGAVRPPLEPLDSPETAAFLQIVDEVSRLE